MPRRKSDILPRIKDIFDMNIDELKNQWKSIDAPRESEAANSRELISRVTRGQVSTLRDRYLRISRMLTFVCVGGVLISIPYISASPLLGVLMILYFIILGGMHVNTLFTLKDMRLSDMTLREAMRQVCRLERERIAKRAIGISLAVPLMIYLFMTLRDNYGNNVLAGCVIGAVIGLVIGLLINRRATDILRQMKEELGKYEQD